MTVFKSCGSSFILQNKTLSLVENYSSKDLQTHWAPKDGVNQPVKTVELASWCINIKSGAFCVNNTCQEISAIFGQ